MIRFKSLFSTIKSTYVIIIICLLCVEFMPENNDFQCCYLLKSQNCIQIDRNFQRLKSYLQTKLKIIVIFKNRVSLKKFLFYD